MDESVFTRIRVKIGKKIFAPEEKKAEVGIQEAEPMEIGEEEKKGMDEDDLEEEKRLLRNCICGI